MTKYPTNTLKYIQPALSLSLLFLFIWLLTWSCERKSDNPDFNDTIPDYTRSEFMIMGDTSNVLITYFDSLTLVWPKNPQPEDFFYIDHDQDGIYDSELFVARGTWFSCIDSSIKALAYETSDTVFKNFRIETRIKEIGGTPWVIINNIYTYSCRQISPEDAIFSVSRNKHLRILNSGDTISINDDWYFNHEFDVIGGSTNGFGQSQLISEHGDTAEIWSEYYIRDCYKVKFHSPYYIGVKLNRNNEVRLGWLYLLSNNYGSVTLLQSGIQK